MYPGRMVSIGGCGVCHDGDGSGSRIFWPEVFARGPWVDTSGVGLLTALVVRLRWWGILLLVGSVTVLDANMSLIGFFSW